jgi:PilZ domain
MRMTDRERREEKRVPTSLEARWEGLSGKHAARISDISMGGCFIESMTQVAIGDFVVLEIRMPDGEWLQIRGSVASYDPHIGFSVSFTFLTDEEQRSLAQLIY